MSMLLGTMITTITIRGIAMGETKERSVDLPSSLRGGIEGGGFVASAPSERAGLPEPPPQPLPSRGRGLTLSAGDWMAAHVR